MRVSGETRLNVVNRARFRCELCGGPLDPMSVHHRRPRGMGGTRTPWVNEAENLLAICGTGTTGCHGFVESRRTDAYAHGWLLRTGMDPGQVPFADLAGRWWLLKGLSKVPIALPFDPPPPPVAPPR